MYAVRPADDDHWLILDESDQTVFIGTLRECEDWLDIEENLPSADPVLFRLGAWILHALGRVLVFAVRAVGIRRSRDSPSVK